MHNSTTSLCTCSCTAVFSTSRAIIPIQPAILRISFTPIPRDGDCGGSKTYAAGHSRFGGVKWDHVFVGMDSRVIQRNFELFAAHICPAQINQHQSGYPSRHPTRLIPSSIKPLARACAIVKDLLGVHLEFRFQRFAKCHRFGGDDMHQRAHPVYQETQHCSPSSPDRLYRGSIRRAVRARSCVWWK